MACSCNAPAQLLYLWQLLSRVTMKNKKEIQNDKTAEKNPSFGFLVAKLIYIYIRKKVLHLVPNRDQIWEAKRILIFQSDLMNCNSKQTKAFLAIITSTPCYKVIFIIKCYRKETGRNQQISRKNIIENSTSWNIMNFHFHALVQPRS